MIAALMLVLAQVPFPMPLSVAPGTVLDQTVLVDPPKPGEIDVRPVLKGDLVPLDGYFMPKDAGRQMAERLFKLEQDRDAARREGLQLALTTAGAGLVVGVLLGWLAHRAASP